MRTGVKERSETSYNLWEERLCLIVASWREACTEYGVRVTVTIKRAVEKEKLDMRQKPREYNYSD